MKIFRDRREAGRELAKRLAAYRDARDVVVLGLPRGGLPVAAEVAGFLGAPLGVQLVRKLGVPGEPELAMGAIASGGVIVRNEEVFRMLRISEDDLQQVAEREQLEMLRRERAYLGNRPRPLIAGRTVIVVDDGMATGSTMQAAVLALRQSGAGRIIVAAPTASHQACALLRDVVDECICLSQPQPYYAVGQSYLSFPQTSDAEVTALLDEAAKRTAERGPSADQR